MLARNLLQSARRTTAGFSLRHASSSSVIVTVPPRMAQLESQIQELTPKVQQMRDEHRNIVVSLQQDMKQLQSEVQQINFKMTTREVTESVDGFRDELLKLREQIAMVTQTCEEISGIKREIQGLEGAQTALAASAAGYHDDSRNLWNRFKYSVEVGFSKLLPAGMGWQFAGNIADGMGFAANSCGFAIITGIGDGLGVLIGHTSWYVAKKFIFPRQNISIKHEASLASLLGTAAVLSGTAWQPVVNLCGTLGFQFGGTFALTGAVCGSAFFVGLRIFRAIYSHFMPVTPPNYQNIVGDAQLSMSIAGAAGTFTGTDPLLAGNFYASYIGIQSTDAAFTGVVKAGSSTWLGFLKIQSVQNFFYPANRNWIDGPTFRVPE